MRYLILILLICTSCKVKEKIVEVDKYHERVVYKDTVIKGKSVTDTFTIEVLKAYPVNRWVVVKDTSGKVELSLMRDSIGNILARCASNDETITKKDREITHLKQQLSEKTIYKAPTWVKWAIAIGLILLLLALLFKFL